MFLNNVDSNVFVGTIAFERSVTQTIYKAFSKETIDYIIEKKNDLKKIPLLDSSPICGESITD